MVVFVQLVRLVFPRYNKCISAGMKPEFLRGKRKAGEEEEEEEEEASPSSKRLSISSQGHSPGSADFHPSPIPLRSPEIQETKRSPLQPLEPLHSPPQPSPGPSFTAQRSPGAGVKVEEGASGQGRWREPWRGFEESPPPCFPRPSVIRSTGAHILAPEATERGPVPKELRDRQEVMYDPRQEVVGGRSDVDPRGRSEVDPRDEMLRLQGTLLRETGKIFSLQADLLEQSCQVRGFQ